MTVVTPQQYRERTNDTEHFWTEILTWLTDAQGLVEGFLRRRLDSAQYTESLPVNRVQNQGWNVRGAVYPTAYPVTVVPSGYTLRYGRVLLAGAAAVPWDFLVEPFGDGVAELTVTYTGGYTSVTLPTALRYGIIDVAQAVGAPQPVAAGFAIPEGASSVTLGDAAVTFRDPEVAGNALDELVPGVCNRLKGYRNRM